MDSAAAYSLPAELAVDARLGSPRTTKSGREITRVRRLPLSSRLVDQGVLRQRTAVAGTERSGHVWLSRRNQWSWDAATF